VYWAETEIQRALRFGKGVLRQHAGTGWAGVFSVHPPPRGQREAFGAPRDQGTL